jgi:hypothetical protein
MMAVAWARLRAPDIALAEAALGAGITGALLFTAVTLLYSLKGGLRSSIVTDVIQAVLFVTTEYNRSIPAPMKNAIDVGSRPYGQSAFSGKPGAVLSTSPGAVGGFGANHHLRQCLVFLDVHVLQQPEAYLGGAGNFFDENGVLSDGIKPFLQKFIDAYAAWVAKQA